MYYSPCQERESLESGLRVASGTASWQHLKGHIARQRFVRGRHLHPLVAPAGTVAVMKVPDLTLNAAVGR